ncbi:hypothetical protein TWF481_008214 [Arthrobotrys musiformis]|uniref:Myb-like domain-containing protein n=1 Tax=Arthrobotrys musiformis TaxID=47236 RepID=A0AAV9W8L2_9PEZI
MVSTRTKGSPVVMLDDHDNPVKQTSSTSPSKKQTRQSKNPHAEEPKLAPMPPPIATRSTRNTRNNPNPPDPAVEPPSKPEQSPKKQNSSKSPKKPTQQPSKTTPSEKDVFDLPDKSSPISSNLRTVKYKGRSIVLKPTKPNPSATVEVEIVEQNGNGGLDDAAEGDDGDDELDEGETMDADDTLGGDYVPGEGGEEEEDDDDDDDDDEEEEEEEEDDEEEEEKPKEPKKKLGRPPKQRNNDPITGASKTQVQNAQKKQQKKRRKNQGDYYGDAPDDSEKDENLLGQTMTMKEFSRKIQNRASIIEQKLSEAFEDLKPDRKSIERRLRAAGKVLKTTTKEFNRIGVYNGISLGQDDPNGRTTIPRILHGDPFPLNTTEFDENHPEFQALFPTERMDYELDIFREQRQHVTDAVVAVNELHRISEKIWLMAMTYKTQLAGQMQFLAKCEDRVGNIKRDYTARRKRESEQNRDAAQAAQARKAMSGEGPFIIPDNVLGRIRGLQRTVAETIASRPAFSRKRGLEAPDEIVSKRQRVEQERNRLSRGSQSSTSGSTAGAGTPPPTDRVVVELFGDHTPGRARRIHQRRGANGQASSRPSGIHDDNAPWTADENTALDDALRQITEKKGRWRSIKSRFGGPGTALAERSGREIELKAIEYKRRIEGVEQEIPDYWKSVGPASDAGEE